MGVGNSNMKAGDSKMRKYSIRAGKIFWCKVMRVNTDINIGAVVRCCEMQKKKLVSALFLSYGTVVNVIRITVCECVCRVSMFAFSLTDWRR